MDQESIILARKANLVEYLHMRGYSLKPEGKGNYRIAGQGGLIVKENYFRHCSTGKRGNAVDFIIEYENCSFKEAVERLVRFGSVNYCQRRGNQLEPGQAAFELPLAANNNNSVIKYLVHHRRIPASIVKKIENLGILYQDQRANCVFVCQDRRAAFLRGTNLHIKWRGMAAGSDSSYPWVWMAGDRDIMVVCESPIDCMSFYALNTRNCMYVATNGLRDAALIRAIHTSRPKHVILAIDNDAAGRTVSTKWQKQVEKDQIVVSIERSNHKDWNETLKNESI